MFALLPLLEAAWMFLVVCATVYISAYHGLTAWPAPVTVAAQAVAVSLSAVVGLYYNGLYDFRVAGTLRELWGRLLRAVLLAGVFLTAVCAWFPGGRVQELPVAAAFVMRAF